MANFIGSIPYKIGQKSGKKIDFTGIKLFLNEHRIVTLNTTLV